MLRRVSESIKDLTELFLLPSLSGILPWRLTRAAFRRALTEGALYWDESKAAFEVARNFIPIPHPENWMQEYRLGRLLDHADLYLTLTRSDRWIDHWVRVEGEWPKEGPFVVITFHYGSGFWGVRHLRRAGHVVQAVRRGFDRALFGPRMLQYRYAVLRIWATDRAFGEKTIPDDIHSLRRLLRTLRDGQSILGLFDVPADNTRNALMIPFLGRTAAFPKGLLYLAKVAHAPIVVYTVRNNYDSGIKTLRIAPPISVTEEQRAAKEVVSILESALRECSSEWHHWAGIGQFLEGVGSDGQNP